MTAENISKELFLEILQTLNERLGENKLNMSLSIYGESVMVVYFNVRSVTRLDVVSFA